MVNRNIQIKKKNNGNWENLYPITLNENVFSSEGKSLENEINTILNKIETNKTELENDILENKNKLDSNILETDLESRRTKDFGLQNGKNVHIYKWGSSYGGNDWCFVRTPESYNIKGKPSGLVILNHGNGWVMDGTEKMANFSSKTQFGVDTQNSGAYLDEGRSDFVRYSSPLIESLLDRGYVVAGAQNDGDKGYDAGYGNKETVNNIVDFFNHVVDNFHVTNHCSMIGASVGCINTINATHILGRDKIRNVVLLYPFLNLYYGWKNNSAWKQKINSAFGITGNAFSDFNAQTTGYNPLDTYTEFRSLPATNEKNYFNLDRMDYSYDQEGKTTVRFYNNFVNNEGLDPESDLRDFDDNAESFYKTANFNYPPILSIWSTEDITTHPDKHWSPFRKLLVRNKNIVKSLEVTGIHGSYQHFNVNEILDWIR